MLASQNVWIGITVGVFFAGLAIGFVAFSSPMNNQHMMSGSQSQMIDSMINDPQAMREWMQDPAHVEDMAILMRDNHDFAMEMMYAIIEDPSIRLQMLGHMTEDPDTMKQLHNMMSGTENHEMVNHGDSGHDMMGQEMIQQMMQDPQTKEMLLQAITNHVTEMQDLVNADLSDEEFSAQMAQMMENHMSEMKELKEAHKSHHSTE